MTIRGRLFICGGLPGSDVPKPVDCLPPSAGGYPLNYSQWREHRMPEQSWSAKRERQYKHIKASERSRGAGEDRAGKRQGPGGPTRDQLYNEAKKRNITGRSTMTKTQLQDALGR